jgi:hypothetical protein
MRSCSGISKALIQIYCTIDLLSVSLSCLSFCPCKLICILPEIVVFIGLAGSFICRCSHIYFSFCERIPCSAEAFWSYFMPVSTHSVESLHLLKFIFINWDACSVAIFFSLAHSPLRMLGGCLLIIMELDHSFHQRVLGVKFPAP